jgi:pimeloyl-ACP methyl ester carboxylesterase
LTNNPRWDSGIEFLYPQVRSPSLVVWGAYDTVDAVPAGRHTAALLHARFVAVPRAGHISMLAAPARVARAIEGFAGRP